MRKRRIDWLAAKQYYFSNPKLSFQDVADKFGCSRYTIKNRALKEKWSGMREKQFTRIEERVLEEQGEDINTIRVRQSKILKSLLAKALSRLQNADFSGVKEVALVNIILDILRSERELYPKQLELGGKTATALSLENVPQEVIDAFIEVFEQKIRGDSVPRIKNNRV